MLFERVAFTHAWVIAVCSSPLRHSVTATASTRDKLEWLLSMPNGATHAVNYTNEDFSEEVKKATDGKGVDVIVDFVGRTHWEKNVESLAIDGRMVLLALLSGTYKRWQVSAKL